MQKSSAVLFISDATFKPSRSSGSKPPPNLPILNGEAWFVRREALAAVAKRNRIDAKGRICPFLRMSKYQPNSETYTAMKPDELRAAREEMGLTQMEAARKYEIKLRTYKNYELGGTAIPGPVRLLTAFFVREHRKIDVKY